jgi:hypothetical protein
MYIGNIDSVHIYTVCIAYIYVCVCVCVCIYMYVYMYVFISAAENVMCGCTHEYTFAHVCMYDTYTYVCTIYIYFDCIGVYTRS